MLGKDMAKVEATWICHRCAHGLKPRQDPRYIQIAGLLGAIGMGKSKRPVRHVILPTIAGGHDMIDVEVRCMQIEINLFACNEATPRLRCP